ncbi:MAG: DUF1624 domain-containing protein, partial [Blastocatellia bacterium]
FLEFTLIRFLIVFNLDYTFVGMAQVIWVIGVSMIAMAALIYLPLKVVGLAGILMIVLHNLLDPIQVPPQIAFLGTPPPDFAQAIWIALHQPGVIPLFGGTSQILSIYPLVPWIGVMMAGYALGALYDWESGERRKLLLKLGLAGTVLFVIVRVINVYGDPAPWRYFETSSSTILSFFNTTKYPPSLLFLLMTLGPALLILALSDRIDGNAVWQRVCITFGRVPMFFYILQWIFAHGSGVILAWLAGFDTNYLFFDPFKMSQAAPSGHGFSLLVVYAVWIGGLFAIYPLCSWFAGLKKRNRHWALSYL